MDTSVKTAKVVEVLGDIKCDLSVNTLIRAVELYHDLHGVWPMFLYIQLEDMMVAEEILHGANKQSTEGSPWSITYIVDDPPQFEGWGVGNSYDHLVGSEGI